MTTSLDAAPDVVTTSRLTLRRWQVDDAPHLKAALDPSVAHLEPWIPWSVAEPASVSVLETRLTGYRDDFDAGRMWLYGIFPLDASEVLGGIGIYPRSAAGRVPFAEADRVEIGYWLRIDVTGRGYATEATRAIVDVARALRSMRAIEIRCDARNVASVAVPQRLGFQLAQMVGTAAGGAARELLIWQQPIDAS